MRDEIISPWNIPDLKLGYNIPVTREEFEKFMETWEQEEPKYIAKWGVGGYSQPVMVSTPEGKITYAPMKGLDHSYDASMKEGHSVNNTPQVVFIDMKKIDDEKQ